MLAKILFLPDLHKRCFDSDSISGQMDAIKRIQKDIINLNQLHGFTHNIILGDWYHKGFRALDQAFGAIQEDRELAESVNGNVYLLVGNHFYLEKDCNPEMYIIQPNNLIQPIHEITTPKEPIFRVVQTLRLGPVQIDFHHFSKTNKDYVYPRQDDVSFRIGLFHDDKTLPGWVREKAGYRSGSVSQPYLNRVYEDLDLAIHGHIHTPIGVVKIELATGKTVPAIIPGSMSVVMNKDSDIHEYVNLPVIEIDDDGKVRSKQIRQSTHMECLVFKKKKTTEVLDSKSESLNVEQVFAAKDINNVADYLTKHGHSDEVVTLLQNLYTTPMSLDDMVHYIVKEKELNERLTGSL